MRSAALLLSGVMAIFAAEPVVVTTPAEPRAITLEEAIRLSISIAPVGIANLDVAIARAGYGAERSALLPTLSATGGLTRATNYIPYTDPSVNGGPSNIWDARLRVGQALLDLEAWHRTAAADRQLAAADALLAVTIEDAAESAGNAYVTLANAQELARVRQEALGLAEDLQRQAQARVDAGASEAIAATRAATRSESARAALIAAQGTSRRAAIILTRALNLDPNVTIVASVPLSETLALSSAPLDRDQAQEAARTKRPELRASAETLAVLDEQRRATLGSRFPKLSAFADGGRTGANADDTVTAWEAGLQLTIPLIDRRRYDERGAEIRVAQQRLRLEDLGQRIRAEVREALETLTSAQATLQAEQVAKNLADRQVSEARTRFDAGAAGNIEVVEAQVSLSQAQERVVSALATAAQARVRLARAVGAATTIR